MFKGNSLRSRMLLVFFVILMVIVAITLFTVQNATYSHSRGQVQSHAVTSARVVEDKFLNRSEQLESALNTLSRDFSTKRLIAGGRQDPESLKAALVNHQRRIQADLVWTSGAEGGLIAASAKAKDFGTLVDQAAVYSELAIHWYSIDDVVYLIQLEPVRFVESSPKVNAWLGAAYRADKLLNDDLFQLTDMQITLLQADGVPVASTFDDELLSTLPQHAYEGKEQLGELRLNDQDYIYAAFDIGSPKPLTLMLASSADKAFLSYNSLIGQLIYILAPAALLTLLAAIAVSNGVTRPLRQLMDVASLIRKGEYVDKVPREGTEEVASLASAIDDMQLGIREREAAIQELAYYDTLTGLPNRNHFTNHIRDNIDSGTGIAVMMMDLDRFKEINDTLGHHIGDEVLKLVAGRLKDRRQQGYFTARLGGDEYGVVLPAANTEDATQAAHSLFDMFNTPLEIEGINLDIAGSVGIALFPEHGKSPSELIQCADIAMYQCKLNHKDFVFYQPEFNQHSVERLRIMTELRSAVSSGQLVLYFQPKIALPDRKVVGAEALIRWIHPEQGFIPPDRFIPLAEQTGAIREVTHYAIRAALKSQQHWHQLGYDLNIAVNISALDLVDMKLPVFVADALKDTGVDPSALTLEVTESSIMEEPETAIAALQRLQDMGITLSIDDFGTGYSSMAQLKKMPVQELKIDRAFVMDMVDNTEDQIMVRTLISLAKNLGLTTVAEGIEVGEALDLLAQYGCTKAQGYYMSKPLAAIEFERWLADYQPPESGPRSI